jgi:AcrR family transcriptional regulator
MSAKRQQLVDTAIDLFSAHGFHGVGIDRIAEEANVSKKTMYQHFRSKEELILAALRHHDGLFRNHFMKAVEARGGTPYERLLAIFDVAREWFTDNRFYGCMFINAVGEYSQPGTPIRQVCREFKRLMRSYIEKLAEAAGLHDAAGVAAELAILLEGSIVTAQVSGTPDCAMTAKRAAKVLIDNALRAQ